VLSIALKHELDVDDPRTTAMWRELVQRKDFLRQVYQEWYSAIASALPAGPGAVLELGSGAGFLAERIPGLVTSDIMHCPGIRAVLDAHTLPFEDGSLRAIVMTDVIHHLPRVEAFLDEASRCVRAGGVVAMVEPWISTWSRFIYHYLHPEPVLPEAHTWSFESTGPLSGANSALPWIMFERDRQLFTDRFPEWDLKVCRLEMPFRYLLSGGLSPISLMPGASFGMWRSVEERLRPWMRRLAMFAFIVLERRPTTVVTPAQEPSVGLPMVCASGTSAPTRSSS
jgi:SAM-dependent methyltransferase